MIILCLFLPSTADKPSKHHTLFIFFTLTGGVIVHGSQI